MDKTANIAQQFNAVSAIYDRQRRELIPNMDIFYNTALEISEQAENVTKILDLGAGTGLMSAYFYSKYPDAHFKLIDISEDMLQKAKERFKLQKNFTYTTADFASLDIEENTFDLIVSSLAIHHLDDKEKQSLFKLIYKGLKKNGWFINADQVLGENEIAEKIYTSTWRNMVLNNANLSETDKKNTFERIKLDKMGTLQNQLNWLKNEGFRSADNYYQHYNFVVFAAQK